MCWVRITKFTPVTIHELAERHGLLTANKLGGDCRANMLQGNLVRCSCNDFIGVHGLWANAPIQDSPACYT